MGIKCDLQLEIVKDVTKRYFMYEKYLEKIKHSKKHIGKSVGYFYIVIFLNYAKCY